MANPPFGHRTAHLPALYQAARLAAHAEGAQGRTHRQAHRRSGVRGRPGQSALDALQGDRAGADVAVLGGLGKHIQAVGSGMRQPVLAPMAASLTFERHEFGDMLRLFHLLALIVAAGMAGDDLPPVEDIRTADVAGCW